MSESQTPGEALVASGETIVRVTHESMQAVSRQHKRDLKMVRDAVLEELKLSPELACRGFFSKPVGDGKITGPSIHLARLVARNFGNCSVRSFLMGMTGEGIYSLAGVFIDLEANVVIERVLPVSIMAWRKGGPNSPGFYDELVGEKLMQALLIGASKAERNVISAGVPDWMMQQAFARCKQLAAESSRSKLGEMIEHCEKFGVTREQLEREMGGPLNADLTDEQIADMRGLANGLVSGDVKAAEIGVEKEPEQTADPAPVDVDAIVAAGASITKGIDARSDVAAANGSIEPTDGRAALKLVGDAADKKATDGPASGSSSPIDPGF